MSTLRPYLPSRARLALGSVAVVAATATLAAPALLAGPAQAAAPAAVPSSGPVHDGATWLAGQLTDGLMHNRQYDFDDYGLSVDTGLALDAIGDHTTVSTISNALKPVVADYYSYPAYDENGTKVGTHISAGSLAKALVFAQVAGDDPTSYGGENLVSLLDDRVSTDADTLGRISDQVVDGGQYEQDYANTIGQAFAERGLETADDARAGSVFTYLRGQQCDAGFFRLALGASLTDTCDNAANPEPSVDTTALVMLQLEESSNPAAAGVVSEAASWLKSQQQADGSFTDGTSSGKANTNSSGLAAWALGNDGANADQTAAAKAATYVRGLQAADPTACSTKLTPDNGAIAYNRAAFDTARTDGIDATTSDQFRRATSQALPALASAPTGSNPHVTVPKHGLVAKGKKLRFFVRGLPKGSTACVSGQQIDDTLVGVDSSDVTVKLAGVDHSVHRTAVVTTVDGTVGTAKFHVLGGKRFAVQAPGTVKVKKTYTVVVTKMAAHEPAAVKVDGHQIAKGEANGRGVYRIQLQAPAKPGRHKVRIKGAFSARYGQKTIKVVRG